MIPARELYWHISSPWLIYPLMFLALAICFYGFFRRYSLWKKGKPISKPNHIAQRVNVALNHTLGQRRILREKFPGMMHVSIFWGFIVLAFGTFAVAVQDHFGLPLLSGSFYLGLSLFLDIFGFLAILGVLLAAFRRYILKPDRLDNTLDDFITLALLFAILASGFVLESLRIAGTQDPWAVWSPVGKLGAVFCASLSLEEIISTYQMVWWGHLVLALGLIAYLPFSKLLHIFTSPVSIFLSSIEPQGALPYVDLEDETTESYGIAGLEDFTWKQLMDASSCTRCGRCQEYCPAYLTHKPLSPKENIQAMKGRNKIAEEALWSCTTCGSCEEQCPVFIEHVEMTVGWRRHLVLMENTYPIGLKAVYRNLENNANPWGMGSAERARWVREGELKFLAKEQKVEYLYWVGCSGAFDRRYQKVATAVCQLLRAAGVSFAILGNQEKCCGDPARRTGNEYLFQVLAKHNIATLHEHGLKKVLTSCPHCYNTLKNDYPQLGADFEVIHHAQLLEKLLRSGKIRLVCKEDVVTYHDSCYLGRYNGIFREPRNVLNAISGQSLIEMKGNKQKSFCCGAGGGRMWLEEIYGNKINEKRAEDILACGAKQVATACPFCLTMLEDGLKAKGMEHITVADISEMLWDACSDNPVRSEHHEDYSVGQGDF